MLGVECGWLLDRIYQFGMERLVWSGAVGRWQCNQPYNTTWHTWWPSQNATPMTPCIRPCCGIYRLYSGQLSADGASKKLNIDTTCPPHFLSYTSLIWPFLPYLSYNISTFACRFLGNYTFPRADSGGVFQGICHKGVVTSDAENCFINHR